MCEREESESSLPECLCRHVAYFERLRLALRSKLRSLCLNLNSPRRGEPEPEPDSDLRRACEQRAQSGASGARLVLHGPCCHCAAKEQPPHNHMANIITLSVCLCEVVREGA